MSCLTVLFLFSFYVFGSSSQVPRVEIPLGIIDGFLDKSINGRTIYSFEGIPYARPPVGKYRFKEPIPPKPWKGVWKANTKFECLQYNHFARLDSDPVDGTEDCLYVNIYTPSLHGNFDVVIFIHGGAFIFGAGYKYGPNILLDRDVVYITLNYRLGPLGFLSTEDDVVPGNNGMKDQILALKWIKENIQYFGGNPESITISGMSAGGASVHFHTLSSKSKDLFHKAISMSGCMLNPWVLMENPLERSKELASIVGCETNNNAAMVDCLRRRPGKQIVAVVGKFQPWGFNPFSPFGLVVDKWASDPVLPKHPLELLKEKAVANIPWIVSHTTQEGLYNGFDFYEPKNLDYVSNNWNKILPHILHYNYTIEQSLMDSLSSKIKDEYLGENPLTKKTFGKLIELMGDRLFKVDLDKCTRLQSAAIKSPVFYYEFGYRGAHSWTDLRTQDNEDIGVSHGDDTTYVLQTPIDTQSTEKDRAISKLMLDIYVSFARKGKPELQFKWIPTAKDTRKPLKYLNINSASPKNEEIEEFGNRKFWDSLPFQENEKLLTIKDEL